MTIDVDYLELLQPEPTLQGEAGAEAEIVLPDYCPDVLRILQTDAEASVESVIPAGNKVTVEGGVEHTVLYLAEDGGEICAARQQSRFRFVFERTGDENADFQVSVRTRNPASRALSPRKVLTRASVCLQMKTDRNQRLSLPEADGDLERRTLRITAAAQVAAGRKPLRIADEFEAGDAAVKTVLCSRVVCKETEQKPLDDKVIAKGELIADLLCVGIGGEVFSLRRTVPISQILDLPGTRADDLCLIRWEPVQCTFTPREAGSDGEQVIAYDLQIDVCACAYRSREITCTEDAYSVKDLTECVYQDVTFLRILPLREEGTFRETVEAGAVGTVLWSEVTPQIRDAVREDGVIRCDGVWEARILLKDPEGTPVSTVREIPFSLSVNDPGTGDLRNDTQLTLTAHSVTVSDPHHVQIEGSWIWHGALFAEQTVKTVERVNRSGGRPRENDTVVLYYAAAGESVWQIAKQHACPCEDLKRINQLSDDALKEDRMLMIVKC